MGFRVIVAIAPYEHLHYSTYRLRLRKLQSTSYHVNNPLLVIIRSETYDSVEEQEEPPQNSSFSSSIT